MINALNRLKTTTQTVKQLPIFRNESGVAAMEFALIAPLIIGLYLGLAELSAVLSADRKISHSASVAGDLVTQVEDIGTSDAEEVVSAVLHVVNMKTIQNYGLRIESFERDGGGNITSAGEIVYQAGSANIDAYNQADLTTEILPNGTGVVVASVRYIYKPFGFTHVDGEDKGKGYLPNEINLTESFIMKPRRSTIVEIGNGGASTVTCSGSTTSVSCS